MITSGIPFGRRKTVFPSFLSSSECSIDHLMTLVKPEAVLLLKHISIPEINQINYASFTTISYTQFLVYAFFFFTGVIYFSCLSLANINSSVSGGFERKGHCGSTAELKLPDATWGLNPVLHFKGSDCLINVFNTPLQINIIILRKGKHFNFSLRLKTFDLISFNTNNPIFKLIIKQFPTCQRLILQGQS